MLPCSFAVTGEAVLTVIISKAGDFSINRRLTNTEWMKNNAADFWKLPWSVHSDSFLLTSRDDLFCAPRMESRSARCPRSVCSTNWKPNLYKACYLMATCMWQLCDWTNKSPHEGGTQRFVYRWTTKHHRMQSLFLWHYTDWKDVLYFAGWLEILPASWVRTFSGTRVRIASNTVETKHVLTSTCWLTNDFFGTMCPAFCQQCPNHEQRGLITLSLGVCIILQHFLCHSCVCVGRCVLLLRCIKAGLNNFAWNEEITVMLPEVTLRLQCKVALSCACFCDPRLEHWRCG